MHFFRSRAAHHAHDLAAGGAAHDGIVDQNDAFAFQQAAHRVQLEFHAEVAHALFRLNEGAPDVMIADQAEAERECRSPRRSPSPRSRRSRAPGQRYRHPPGLLSPVDGPCVSRLTCTDRPKTAVGPRKINVLKDAARLRLPAPRKSASARPPARPRSVRPALHRARSSRRSDRRRRSRMRRRQCLRACRFPECVPSIMDESPADPRREDAVARHHHQ